MLFRAIDNKEAGESLVPPKVAPVIKLVDIRFLVGIGRLL